MIRTVRVLAVLATAAATLVVASSAAHSGAPPDVAPTILTIDTGVAGESLKCAQPYLATAYGPIAQCTKIGSGKFGVPGLYSPFTHFVSSTAPAPVMGFLYFQTVLATDGFSATAIGYGLLTPPRSNATVYVTQYSGNRGRFGSVDLRVQLFTPSSPWFDIVR